MHRLRRCVLRAQPAHEFRQRFVALANVDLQEVTVDTHLEHQRFARQERRGCGDVVSVRVTEREAVAGDLALEFGRASERDDLTAVDDCDSAAQRVGLFEIVRREEDARPGFVECGDLFPHARPALRIETGARFVEKEQLAAR